MNRTMKNLKYYLEKARKENFAIAQFNFSDFTQVKAIVAVAEKMKSPIILGTSEGESKFFGLKEAVAIRNVLKKKTGLPIFLNLDHGKTSEYVKEAINAGYDLVHFDGSKLQLEENIKITKELTKYAFWRFCLVEGEVGKIGTESSKVYAEKFEARQDDLTKPEDAKKFVEDTEVDLLAVGIGNFHGVQTSGLNPNLRIDVLTNIKKSVGDVGLVLHGGSGTPENDIKEVIKLGIVKININTELRLALANGLKEALNTNEIVPYKFLSEAQKSVEKIVENKINLFGSSNKI
jgi:fructose-bisphosphate aldolase class II